MTFVEPKPNTVFGCDVSFYQDNNATPQKINFEKMFAAGASFVFIRAGQNLWKDPDFVDNWKAAKGILPRGAYFYLDARASIRQQAKIFSDVLKDDPGELLPVVDFEQTASAKAGITSQLEITHFDAFNAYLNEYGIKETITYTGKYFWQAHGSPHARYAESPLWIARYGADEPLIPLPWKTWMFWQFTDKGDGIKYGCESLNVDLNYFNGSLTDLYDITKFKPVAEPEKPDPIKVTVSRGDIILSEEIYDYV